MPTTSSLSEEFVELVVWSLDRILRDEYLDLRDKDGGLESVELNEELAPSRQEVDLDLVEQTLKLIYSPEVWNSIESLKVSPSAHHIEKVLRLMFPPAMAEEGADELQGAQWPEILLYIHLQSMRLALVGEPIVSEMIKGREGLGSPSLRSVEGLLRSKAPQMLSLFVARKCARELKDLYPKVLKRVESLSLMSVGGKVPGFVERYLVEASRCYIYGQFLASLFLCRSALVEAVTLKLKDKGWGDELTTIKKDPLKATFELALKKGIVGQETYTMADRVRKIANDAVHGTSLPTDAQCKDAYHETRMILQVLYQEAT